MPEAFGLYHERSSRIHRLDPLTKLTIAAFFPTAGLTLPGMWAAYWLVLFGLIPLGLLGQVFRLLVHRTWRIVLPFAISLFLIQGFLWPGGTPLVRLGPLSLKEEGLQFTILSTGRVLIVVGSFLWLALTTRADFLMLALNQRGLPPSLTYLIVSSIQIIPGFQARAMAILDAQRSRGLEISGNILRRVRAVFPLVVPLILSSLIDVEERAMAIEARGFNHPGTKTSLVELKQSTWEIPLRWLLLIGMLGLIIFRVWPK
jgi:energy-coupling factor transport system permease protein